MHVIIYILLHKLQNCTFNPTIKRKKNCNYCIILQNILNYMPSIHNLKFINYGEYKILNKYTKVINPCELQHVPPTPFEPSQSSLEYKI